MKNLQTFEEFLNENKSINEKESDLNTEQNHIYILMEYILMEIDEDDFDTLRDRISKKFKKNDYQWSYEDIEGKDLVDIKEMLKKYYIKNVNIDKFLKNTSKKWQEEVEAIKWVIS